MEVNSVRSLYLTMRDFAKARAAAREKYLEEKNRLANAQGSAFYDEAMKQAAETRRQTVEAAQVQARAEAREFLEAMREKAAKIEAIPPTPEQLAILETLRMREKLTENDLLTAANAMNGNGLCLSVIQELAAKNDIYRAFGRDTTRLTIAQAHEAIKNLTKNVMRTISDTVGVERVAEMYAERRKAMYGESYDPDDLRQEKPIDNVEDFCERMSGYSYAALSCL